MATNMKTECGTESGGGVGCRDGLGRKRRYPDIAALKVCVRALNESTSRRMLEANLRFLWDRYLTHPSPELPEHLQRMVSPTDELVTKLTEQVSAQFPCFVGGTVSSYDTLSIMLADKPPQFAAGVHVSNVVRFILERI